MEQFPASGSKDIEVLKKKISDFVERIGSIPTEGVQSILKSAAKNLELSGNNSEAKYLLNLLTDNEQGLGGRLKTLADDGYFLDNPIYFDVINNPNNMSVDAMIRLLSDKRFVDDLR